MKQVLLIVSFGTRVEGADSSIHRVENTLRAAAPEMEFRRAYTSPTIRRILAKRGEQVDSLEEALQRLKNEGIPRVVVQPTHFFYGYEYDKIRDTVQEYTLHFEQLTLGKPLAASIEDLRAIAACVMEEYLPAEDALVFMGHGSDHFGSITYPAFQTVLDLAGAKNTYVGTVDGWPAIEDVIPRLKQNGHKKVKLVPLMLVAGTHACTDMAGPQPTSWKSQLEAAGFEVECCRQGLGELESIRALYLDHLNELLG